MMFGIAQLSHTSVWKQICDYKPRLQTNSESVLGVDSSIQAKCEVTFVMILNGSSQTVKSFTHHYFIL